MTQTSGMTSQKAHLNLSNFKMSKSMRKLHARLKADHSFQGEVTELSAQLFIDQIKSADPTGKYARWILKTYLSGGIRLAEDISGAGVLLSEFDENKRYLEEADIFRYGALPEVSRALSSLKPVATRKARRAAISAEMRAETDIFHESKDLMVLSPRTERASCYWGQGTQWCTAATESENAFDIYHKQGPLIIAITGDRKIQFHPASGQVADVHDAPFVLGSADADLLKRACSHLEPSLVINPVMILRFELQEQTPELCMEAVRNDSSALVFVREKTPELCMAAVEKNGWALQFVMEQTPEICMAAVEKNGLSLQFAHVQTPELCMAAVERNGIALQYVQNQTPDICQAAVKQNDRAINYVIDPSMLEDLDVKMEI